MSKLAVLDLFSGIGGFSLGLERTGGFETVAFCEIEPFPRKVLAKNWPEVPIYDDVRTLTAERLAADGIAVDVICGGFPCQDISTAGKGAGLAGERSGLWSEIARLVGELRPSYVIVENVSALLGRGLGTVLGDLAALGYDAEWHCIPASHVGAPHRRDRIWIIAYVDDAKRLGCNSRRDNNCKHDWNKFSAAGEHAAILAHTEGDASRGLPKRAPAQDSRPCSCGEDVANATGKRQQGQGQPIQRSGQAPDGKGQANQPLSIRLGGVWPVEPDVGRVAHGISDRSHRLKGLGNAVVPQIPELIGRAILEARQWTQATS
jgi:DNA (cytosine-5)-methyltransferase 1